MQCAKIVTRHFFVYLSLPAIIYLCEFSNGNTRTMREMCSELTIKASERGQWHVCGIWPCQASKIKLLVKIINNLKPLTIFTKISILQVWSGHCLFWSVFSRIWTEWGKMQDRKTLNSDNHCKILFILFIYWNYFKSMQSKIS